MVHRTAHWTPITKCPFNRPSFYISGRDCLALGLSKKVNWDVWMSPNIFKKRTLSPALVSLSLLFTFHFLFCSPTLLGTWDYMLTKLTVGNPVPGTAPPSDLPLRRHVPALGMDVVPNISPHHPYHYNWLFSFSSSQHPRHLPSNQSSNHAAHLYPTLNLSSQYWTEPSQFCFLSPILRQVRRSCFTNWNDTIMKRFKDIKKMLIMTI